MTPAATLMFNMKIYFKVALAETVYYFSHSQYQQVVKKRSITAYTRVRIGAGAAS
jgi:hypothetical protein